MSAALIGNVLAQGEALAAHSWEWGTFSEALLEWHSPHLSVFGQNPFPDGQIPKAQVHEVLALQYAVRHIFTGGNTLVEADGRCLSLPNCPTSLVRCRTASG